MKGILITSGLAVWRKMLVSGFGDQRPNPMYPRLSLIALTIEFSSATLTVLLRINGADRALLSPPFVVVRMADLESRY